MVWTTDKSCLKKEENRGGRGEPKNTKNNIFFMCNNTYLSNITKGPFINSLFLMWSPLVRRHLSAHLLWSIFSFIITHIFHITNQAGLLCGQVKAINTTAGYSFINSWLSRCSTAGGLVLGSFGLDPVRLRLKSLFYSLKVPLYWS